MYHTRCLTCWHECEERDTVQREPPCNAVATQVILDNHSAHISNETRGWLAAQRSGRFEFVFTPTHGSWLNLVEGFFSKLARSVLRHIRVASTQELKDRIMAAIELINHQPASTPGPTC